jgi:uncharacterized protein
MEQFEQPLTPEEYAPLYSQYSDYLNALYDMYYLVEDELDERILHEQDLQDRAQRLSKGAYIGGVQLSVSDACNFACKYCFCDFVDEREEKRRELAARNNKLMSIETAKITIDALIDNVKRNGRSSLVVKFFGREPLTNWRLIKEIMESYGHGEKHGIQIHYAITTNASLVTPEIAEAFARYGVQTTVSVDGLADSNNTGRISKKKGQETFPIIDQGINILHEHNALRTLSAVITDSNFEQFDNRFVDYAHALGVREVQVLLGMQGDFIRRIDPDTAAQKLFDIYTYGHSKGIAITGYWHNSIIEVISSRRLRGDPMRIHGVVESCTATGHQLNVEPSGDIFPCRAMSTHMGHIDDLDGMLGSDTYEHVIMRTYGNVKACRDCPIEGFCQGECLGNLEEKYGDIYAVDEPYCEIYRKIYDKIVAAALFGCGAHRAPDLSYPYFGEESHYEPVLYI